MRHYFVAGRGKLLLLAGIACGPALGCASGGNGDDQSASGSTPSSGSGSSSGSNSGSNGSAGNGSGSTSGSTGQQPSGSTTGSATGSTSGSTAGSTTGSGTGTTGSSAGSTSGTTTSGSTSDEGGIDATLSDSGPDATLEDADAAPGPGDDASEAESTADASDAQTESATADAADTGTPAADAAETGSDASEASVDASVDAIADSPVDAAPCGKVLLTATSATASPNPISAASLAIDGDLTTRWETVHGVDPEFIYVDYGAPVFIDDLQILWQNACATDYTIDVSNDATAWTTVRTITGNNAGSVGAPADWTGATDHSDLHAVGRYLRINGTMRCTQYGYSIWEMRAYGDTNPTCTPEQ